MEKRIKSGGRSKERRRGRKRNEKGGGIKKGAIKYVQ